MVGLKNRRRYLAFPFVLADILHLPHVVAPADISDF